MNQIKSIQIIKCNKFQLNQIKSNQIKSIEFFFFNERKNVDEVCRPFPFRWLTGDASITGFWINFHPFNSRSAQCNATLPPWVVSVISHPFQRAHLFIHWLIIIIHSEFHLVGKIEKMTIWPILNPCFSDYLILNFDLNTIELYLGTVLMTTMWKFQVNWIK